MEGENMTGAKCKREPNAFERQRESRLQSMLGELNLTMEQYGRLEKELSGIPQVKAYGPGIDEKILRWDSAKGNYWIDEETGRRNYSRPPLFFTVTMHERDADAERKVAELFASKYKDTPYLIVFKKVIVGFGAASPSLRKE